MTRLTLAAASLGALALLACSDDPVTGEPTAFEVTIENVVPVYSFSASGTFTNPVGADEPGPLFPGDAFELSFRAAPGAHLSFATMFGQSNDFFYAPDEAGIALYDEDGAPVTGDVTDQVHLWDAGTELDQEPGLGADQAPRQAAAGTGEPDPDPTVRRASDDFDNLPAVADNVRITLTSDEPTHFTLRIENVGTADLLATSDGGTHPAPLSPGVWVVHAEPGALFTEGEADRAAGLEMLAEDGAPPTLAASLAADTGLSTPLAPGAWAVHTAPGVLFEDGSADRGDGLEALAEDGMPGALIETLMAASGVVEAGATSEAPVFSGDRVTVRIEAQPGDRFSFASMFGQSNDLFFAPDPAGIALFAEDGSPRSGDVSTEIALWDAGTEENQLPGVGLDQAPRQSGPNTGADEGGVVQPVADGFAYPAADEVVRVTITPVS